eukprot:TRINITY_DN67602_c10_g5_i1.p1 TRINITY_DN67602_c10_g5~~TRINITY_DN67602_c10_g5_i1.p1  ORF type:complete len:377 (-),score=50.07 TRINITY_DN67602_c10_g5_i1:23-1153(-)
MVLWTGSCPQCGSEVLSITTMQVRESDCMDDRVRRETVTVQDTEYLFTRCVSCDEILFDGRTNLFSVKMTAAATKPKHAKENQQQTHETPSDTSSSPIQIVMSAPTANNLKNQGSKPAPVPTTAEREELNHALELEEEWVEEHGAHVLPEDVRPLQPATHSTHHHNAHQMNAEPKPIIYPNPRWTQGTPPAPAAALHSFDGFVDYVIEKSGVRRWSIRVDKVPIRTDAHAGLLERVKLLSDRRVWNGHDYFPVLRFIGGSDTWSPLWSEATLRDAAITFVQLAPNKLLPLDWFLDEEDAQVWREKTQQEKLQGLPQRLGLVHTAKAILEEQKLLESCDFKADDRWLSSCYETRVKGATKEYQQAKDSCDFRLMIRG